MEGDDGARAPVSESPQPPRQQVDSWVHAIGGGLVLDVNDVGLVAANQVQDGPPTAPVPALDSGVNGELRCGSSSRQRDHVNLATQCVQSQADLVGIVAYTALHGRELTGHKKDFHDALFCAVMADARRIVEATSEGRYQSPGGKP